MLIWRIYGSLRLSQNFVKNWKFSWPRSLAKFQILTNFSTLSFQTCKWIASLKKAFLSVLMSIWRISGSLILSQNFVKNWKFSWPRSLAKFQILTKFSRLSFQTCEWIASIKMATYSVLLFIWMISGSLRLSQNFVKNWKFSWPRSLAKFQILTKFSRLSFQTCEWIASLKMAFYSVLMSIWRISGSLRLSQNFVKNWKFSGPRSLAKFQILTNFLRLSFQTCEWIASLKMAF